MLGQLTLIVVTAAAPTIPEPSFTVHCCPGGWVKIVTAYVAPLAIGVANAKPPFADISRLSAPLFCNVIVAAPNPDTLPPTLEAVVTHATATLVTLLLPIVPLPLLSVQFSPAGCVKIVML